MKTTVSFYDFDRAFKVADRTENFSYTARRILFAYFEDYEESTGQEIELDVIAVCCEYNEDTWQDIADNYDVDLSDCDEDDDDEKIKCVREYLNENTMVCGEHSNGVFVYACF